jgi:hypothetical protein
VVAHIGEWTTASPYTKYASNGFVNRGTHTLPTSESFWQELMGKAEEWGLLVMKQDHINENIEGYDPHYTPTIHPLYTHYTPTLHPLYTHVAPTIHPLYTHYALTVHPICTSGMLIT